MSFSSEFDAASAEVLARATGIVKESVKKLCKNIVMDTPVDTGALRGSWLTSVGAPEISNEPFIDKSGDFPIAENVAVVNAWNPTEELFFANGLDYSEQIEFDGKSGQSPEGMVRVNLARFPGIVADVETGTGRFL
jgi:hypothetical protein